VAVAAEPREPGQARQQPAPVREPRSDSEVSVPDEVRAGPVLAPGQALVRVQVEAQLRARVPAAPPGRLAALAPA